MFNVDPLLVDAVIAVESGGNPKAVSPAGAQGLMQIMPATFDEWADNLRISPADPFDPVVNRQIGSEYLGYLLKCSGGDIELALASYNAGPGRVRKACRRAMALDWNKAKEFLPKETQDYVPKVLEAYRQRCGAVSEV
jgi:soluble lytic murein transglycosylase-like protein